MRWRNLVGVAVVLVSAAGLAGQTQEIQDKTNDLLKLQGTWVFESATLKGMPREKLNKVNLEIQQGKLFFVSSRDGKEQKSPPATFDIDVKKTPRQITIRTVATKKSDKGEEKFEHVMKGVYQLDRDTLKMAMPGPGGKAVTSWKDETAITLTFKRGKK